MHTEALGRLINAHYPADDVYINLSDAGGVTFYIYEVDGATSVTITFSTDAAGSSTSTPDVIDHLYGKSADVSDAVWHETAVSPASETFLPADTTEDSAVVTVLATMCPDGKPWVKATADGSAIVFAITHDLRDQRDPANLGSMIA
jgi:hypothetical protein